MKRKTDRKLLRSEKIKLQSLKITKEMLCEEALSILNSKVAVRFPNDRYADVGSERWLFQTYLTQNKLVEKCTRPHTLGNPFPMYKEEDRDKVCEQFSQYFFTNQNLMDYVDDCDKNIFQCVCLEGKRCHTDTLVDFKNRTLSPLQ